MSHITCSLGPDSAGPLLAAAIAGARSSIVGSFYELGPSFVPPFVAAHRAGARIELVLERHALGNANAATMLRDHGIDVRLATLPNAFVHWKAAVIDESKLILGTGNLIQVDAPQHPADGETLMRGTREWWVLAQDVAQLTASLVERIRAAWTAAPALLAEAHDAGEVEDHGAVGAPHPQVPPLEAEIDIDNLLLAIGGSAVHAQILDAISQPQKRLLLTAPYIFTAGARVLELLEALEPHKNLVQVLLGQPPHPSDLHALRHYGFDVRIMNVERSTRGHAKGVVVDDTAIVSSANWSEPGMSNNDEASMRIVDAAAATYFADAFARDWEVADPA